MKRLLATKMTLLLMGNMLVWAVLSFQRPMCAAPQGGAKQPFANSVVQRAEMVEHLKAIRALLAEQNALLKSGNVQVKVLEKHPR